MASAYDRDCAEPPGFAQALVLDLYLFPVTRSPLLLSLIEIQNSLPPGLCRAG